MASAGSGKALPGKAHLEPRAVAFSRDGALTRCFVECVASVEAIEAGEALKVIMEFFTLHDTEDSTRRWHHL
jgi:hypothetical protein